MNIGCLCQIILKSDKESVIFAYHIVRQTPLIALPPLLFPGYYFFANKRPCTKLGIKIEVYQCLLSWYGKSITLKKRIYF